jgi:hypothetical protein
MARHQDAIKTHQTAIKTHQNAIKTQARESTRVHGDAIKTQASSVHQDPGAREQNAQRARMRAGRLRRGGQKRGERGKRQEAGKSKGVRVCERVEECVCARIYTHAHTDARTFRQR